MGKRKCSLEDDVRAVFERACVEQDFQLAEHLLQALETLAERDGHDEKLKQTYMMMASSLHKNH
ncbi:MAG: hypothetical protein A3I66_03870 [Burkholderiales bacterium RIFCSPLOWO2_02_FULL_57_36]|nr:MAG: hypothetical protein A3I66_03870 [Burkholderiales bacterium RIFCSPLOWO2_02_FULL_57_36]